MPRMASRAGPSAAQREEGEAERRVSASVRELVNGVCERDCGEGGVMVQRQWVREGKAEAEERSAKSAKRVGGSISVGWLFELSWSR